MTAFSNHWFSKGKRKKYYLIVNPIHSRIHLHIYPPVHPVCVVCAVTVQLDSTLPPPPLPTHHTDIHRPLKQDVQKLVFSIKQCRALT